MSEQAVTYRCVRDQTNAAAVKAGLEPWVYEGPCMAECCYTPPPTRLESAWYGVKRHAKPIIASVSVLAVVLGGAPYMDDAWGVLDSFVTSEDTERPDPMYVDIVKRGREAGQRETTP